jgi:hypothetical protein
MKKCSATGTPVAAAMLPVPAPKRPPKLYAEWKVGTIGLPTSSAMCTAAVFMATSTLP